MQAWIRRGQLIGVALAAGAIGALFGPRVNEAQQLPRRPRVVPPVNVAPQPPPRPPRTEYAVSFTEKDDLLATFDRLSKMSADGWELAQIVPQVHGSGGSMGTTSTSYVVIVRRPVP